MKRLRNTIARVLHAVADRIADDTFLLTLNGEDDAWCVKAGKSSSQGGITIASSPITLDGATPGGEL